MAVRNLKDGSKKTGFVSVIRRAERGVTPAVFEIKVRTMNFRKGLASLVTIIALSSASHSFASEKDIANLSDCEYSAQMMVEMIPLMEGAMNQLTQDTNYKDVSEWQASTFNPSYSAIRDKYAMPSSAPETGGNREISRGMYKDVVVGINSFVQEIVTFARYRKNKESKENITKQYHSVEKQLYSTLTTARSFIEKCEGKV